jgi:hypothetical protein
MKAQAHINTTCRCRNVLIVVIDSTNQKLDSAFCAQTKTIIDTGLC